MLMGVQLKDEAPTIGTGYRLVYVVDEGKNTVTLVSPHTLRIAKVSRKEWASLDRSGKEVEVSPSQLAEKAIRYFEQMTKADSEEDGPKLSRIATLRPGLRLILKATQDKNCLHS